MVAEETRTGASGRFFLDKSGSGGGRARPSPLRPGAGKRALFPLASGEARARPSPLGPGAGKRALFPWASGEERARPSPPWAGAGERALLPWASGEERARPSPPWAGAGERALFPWASAEERARPSPPWPGAGERALFPWTSAEVRARPSPHLAELGEQACFRRPGDGAPPPWELAPGRAGSPRVAGARPPLRAVAGVSVRAGWLSWASSQRLSTRGLQGIRGPQGDVEKGPPRSMEARRRSPGATTPRSIRGRPKPGPRRRSTATDVDFSGPRKERRRQPRARIYSFARAPIFSTRRG